MFLWRRQKMDSSVFKLFIILFLSFYFPAIFLFHLMVYRVNSHLPPDMKIPHSLYFGEWKRLAREYKFYYPRSVLYPLTLACAGSIFVLGVAIFCYRFWDLAFGK
jgi:hypothetical protein